MIKAMCIRVDQDMGDCSFRLRVLLIHVHASTLMNVISWDGARAHHHLQADQGISCHQLYLSYLNIRCVLFTAGILVNMCVW